MAMQERDKGITLLRSFHHQQKCPGKNQSAPGEELPRHFFVQKKNAKDNNDDYAQFINRRNFGHISGL